MGTYSGRRNIDGLVSKKGSGLVSEDTSHNRAQNSQYCNRLGCSSRINSTKNAQVCLEKAKSTTQSFRSSSSNKEVVGSSSWKKSVAGPQKNQCPKFETDFSESSSTQDEPEVSELIPQPLKIQRGVNIGFKSSHCNDSSLDVGSSSLVSNIISRRSFDQRSGPHNQSSPVGSRASTESVLGSSSSDPNLSRSKDFAKKTNSKGESSSKGKKISGSSSERRNSSYGYRISISDSTRERNMPQRENGVASVRTRRCINGNNRSRLSSERNGSSLNESPIMISEMNPPDIFVHVNGPSSSEDFATEFSSSRTMSCSRSSSENIIRGIRPTSHEDIGMTHSLVNRESFRHYNINGIAEVLLALERIEQDEELTYEQLILLETNLFLNGLNFYDQHRDMRLDIDNMSYEELLALEERMGTVSTALSEEALVQCLSKSIFKPKSPKDTIICCSEDKDDVKCCICQEEYVNGDEVGSLQCKHKYHVVCIKQWMRLKNWCPICKASVAPAPASQCS